jgi:hypothetical protein
MVEEGLEREKERSKTREQEAFAARYQIVGVQEQLEQALERIKLVEQERDAYKTLAKNEEVARIAAEGRIPLPTSEDQDDEFASPKKRKVSLSTIEIVSSAASEAEIDELTQHMQWERQRANRAQELVEFLQAECELKCCPCAKSQAPITVPSPRRKRPDPLELADPSDLLILREKRCEISVPEIQTPLDEPPVTAESLFLKPEPRRSTIFCPREGIFRTISQQEAEAMDAETDKDDSSTEPPTPVEVEANPRMYARTPSVEPPSFALLAQERTSLLSLLNAPHDDTDSTPLPHIPVYQETEPTIVDDTQSPIDDVTPSKDIDSTGLSEQEAMRPHTSAAFYTVTTTTTVPLRDRTVRPASSLDNKLRTPSTNSNKSFDITNPALTPTMTREQALAQIRERRGRARSAAQGAATPRKQMVTGGGERRDVSAPTGRVARRVRS